MKKQTFYPVIYLFLLLWSVSSCEGSIPFDDSTPGSGHPLAPGEVCYIGFSNSVPEVGEATTRAIPEGKRSVLHDFTNRELKGREGGRAGWVSGEVRTEYDEDVRRANVRRSVSTRSFKLDSQLFGANSKFRMLVFAGSHNGTVNMDSPVANMVCQVNDSGTGASFISPTNQLGLLKGRYTFICFPADEKYNKWQVGQTEGNQISVGADEDFVSMIQTDNIDNTNYQVDLSKFVRFGYELTVKFSVNEELGYLLFPQKELHLTVSDAGSGTDGRIINTGCTFDLKTQSIVNYNGNTAEIKDTLAIDKAEKGQTFTPVANFLMCNPGASQKLTISYPQLTVKKPAGTNGSKEDSVFTIRAGKFTTSEDVTFEAGKSYTITLAIGEQVKGIIVGGVIWSPGNLDYDATTKKYFWAPTPDKAKNVREARGAWFRWMAPLPQSSSNTSTAYINQSWTVTVPNWSGNSKDLGNYNGYYKGIFAGNPELTSGTLPSPLTASSLGDPCWGMGKGWRMPTYNEIYLLCYVSPNEIPSGTFNTAKRNYKENFSGYSGSWNDNVTDEAVRYAGIFFTSCEKPNDNPAAITNISQYDGSQLFLPAAGTSNGSSVLNTGTYGYYWSSTPDSGSTIGSWLAYFRSGYLSPNSGTRSLGRSVRCVLGSD